MASTIPAAGDPLLLLRQAIASNTKPKLTIGDSSESTATEDLVQATHLVFSTSTPAAFALSTPTRFVSSEAPVDLRSIYFAWLHKDNPTEYIPAAQALNDALGENTVRNLVFVERLDLITWLEGSSDDSEYIKPLAGAGAAQATGTAQTASGTVGVATGASGRTAKSGNPILQAIYNNEKRIGDRNSVLRGIKPTDFSHVRKIAENYLKQARQMGKPGNTSANPAHPSNIALASHPKSSSKTKRADPIILLSPSASSLLRMSNIKSFLGDGAYIPADSSVASGDTNMVHITRIIPSVDPTRTQRFIIVDSPDQFKPEYWARVVAVFTTGQTWQFRSYKWQTPQDLFSHVLGIYVGTRGELVPDTVRNWGRGVAALQIDPYLDDKASRWRDREIVENVWSRIEDQMKRSGWTANGPGGRA